MLWCGLESVTLNSSKQIRPSPRRSIPCGYPITCYNCTVIILIRFRSSGVPMEAFSQQTSSYCLPSLSPSKTLAAVLRLTTVPRLQTHNRGFFLAKRNFDFTHVVLRPLHPSLRVFCKYEQLFHHGLDAVVSPVCCALL